MSAGPSPASFDVAIVGGGVAALEAALALGELDAERLHVTLIAPAAEFIYRPMTVREPFAYSPALRYPISEIAAYAGAELRLDSLASLDPKRQVAHTESGGEIHYDAILLAVGATPHARFPAAVTVDDARLDELLHGLLEDVDGGYVRQLAFVIPARVGWPLPIYELALMTAARAYEMDVELHVTIATPERAPLEIFGESAGAAISALLAERGIETITSAHCEVPDGRHVVLNPGDRTIAVDRVVALPELYGPAIRGLPSGEHGFIPVDAHGQVRGAERVFAAGDATDFELKFGGIAAQQADAAAEAIAALAGLPVAPAPFHPVIHGILLTGGAPLYLSARLIGGRGFSSEVSDQPTWSPPAKIAARYLAPYLDTREP
jgi:sulfide:quinone oxidoreductase